MTKYLDLEGLKAFKEQADAAYLPVKGTIPLTGSINLTTETALSLAAKYAKVANNSLNFYVIADSSGKLPSSETRININSSITSLVGAEGANVGDIFVVGKLDLKPVYKVIPLNDAKAENSDYKGTQGVVTPWDKAQINKVPNMESAINAAKNNLPTYSESNMNNALKTGFYPWCTLGRPSGSTGAYTLVTLASTTADNNGYTTIEQTAYGRQNDELGKIFKRIIFKPSSGDTEYGEWKEVTGGGTHALQVKTALFKRNGTDYTYNNSMVFQLPDDMIGCGIIDIRGVASCHIQSKEDNSEATKIYFMPLSVLGYTVTYAEKISDTPNEGDPVLQININTTCNFSHIGKDASECKVELANFPTYIEIDYIPKYYEQA